MIASAELVVDDYRLMAALQNGARSVVPEVDVGMVAETLDVRKESHRRNVHALLGRLLGEIRDCVLCATFTRTLPAAGRISRADLGRLWGWEEIKGHPRLAKCAAQLGGELARLDAAVGVTEEMIHADERRSEAIPTSGPWSDLLGLMDTLFAMVDGPS